MRLISQAPGDEIQEMRSLLYLTAKSAIAHLESAGIVTVRLIQARLLVAIYELGHGLGPVASISVKACGVSARALGLDQTLSSLWSYPFAQSEEERRLWWSIFIVERYIGLVEADDVFVVKAPSLQDILPMPESFLEQETANVRTPQTMLGPLSVTAGSLARLCQACSLAGQVLTHILSPSSDSDFNVREREQLGSTLQAYNTVMLSDINVENSKEYCPAIGVCSSSLMKLYKQKLDGANAESKTSALDALRSISDPIVRLSNLLYNNVDDIDIDSLTLFVPNCLFEAAQVQQKFWKETAGLKYKHGFESLKRVLRKHAKRWRIAGKCLLFNIGRAVIGLGFDAQQVLIVIIRRNSCCTTKLSYE
ncbi:hypothetical protein M409DRAFT_56523 [Zasmidium cellare ATCC 36951]|uniref:Xylanolytic transcriptional activator regulatory domain-containing protein n=1 Tax=Zasmidium cellare ATCC 36951 TaxID=1080233 RepID=A0A6A6CC06_ZASCE|nr:uncharacterized protein M409DRAFT_56523 [Zasmidium cellare ATCC 36951]KAF2164714.1 hypothetical protein M409DRAFT_56523 [Zasmidium cellare ATCC 36951]